MIIGIVDDDGRKRAEIAQIVRNVAGASVDIREAASIITARRLLQVEHLDLLILDIALPDLDDGEARNDGGVALLDEVMSTSRYMVPAQVIGITARDDVYEGAAARFGSELWSVLRFDRASTEWSELLTAKLRHIMRLKQTLLSCTEN